jgi:uncharacterized protein YndB with AHSA1/START domain
MLTAILIILALIAAVLIYAATRPDVFRVERTASIKAPPEKLFAMINDYRNWPAWSPYEKLDPAMQRKLSGPDSGKGSVYEWEGNSKVGKGRMEVLETTPHSNVTIKLDFLKPFEAHNTAVFTLKPNGGATDVTWAMHGPAPFMNKLMGVFMNFDKMIGGQFAEGLANMKAAAEK